MVISILDSLQRIKAIDKAGMINYCADSSKLYKEAHELAEKIQINFAKPNNVIIAGMGGSGIGGELLKDWARTKTRVPIEVNREYNLPNYAGEKTFVFLTSYSGETEESLSAFLDALRRKCMIFCLSSGGALLENAERLRIPYLRVPSGLPPRVALPYMFVPLLIVMERIGLVPELSAELFETIKLLEKVSAGNSIETPAEKNPSKTLAMNIGQKTPVIYGFGIYRSVAMRFKQQFNENSKVPSKWECFSELNHNEIVGWEKANELSNCFSAILIRDPNEPKEISSRIQITKELLSKAGLPIFELPVQGESALAKMLSTICVGDFSSIYLAILQNVDPTPVKTINYLKDTLKQTGTKEAIIGQLKELG